MVVLGESGLEDEYLMVQHPLLVDVLDEHVEEGLSHMRLSTILHMLSTRSRASPPSRV